LEVNGYADQISFVPANHARIGITDKILTRISTRESVSKVQSAFMIDAQQISLALSLATNRSLLIIDEFGKGTEASSTFPASLSLLKANVACRWGWSCLWCSRTLT
jgi:DNA mismatch repair ATPase MutS